MFQYVLFDLDGTLTDPKTGITSCVQYALADAGIEEPDLDKLEPFIGPPLTDSFREFYGFDDEQIKRAIDKYHERFDEKGIFENEIIEGIPEAVCQRRTDKGLQFVQIGFFDSRIRQCILHAACDSCLGVCQCPIQIK